MRIERAWIVGALLLALSTLPAIADMPLGDVKNWSALALRGGMLLHQEEGEGKVPYVFAYQELYADGPELRFLAYRGVDVDEAIAALLDVQRLEDADIKLLAEYAPGFPSAAAAGSWAPLTVDEALDMSRDPLLGSAGTALYAYLKGQRLFAGRASAAELSLSHKSLCGLTNLLQNEVISAASAATHAAIDDPTAVSRVASSGAPAASASTSASFVSVVAQYCSGVWPPSPGTVPAFPITPGFTPPTGPIKWSGTGCTANQVGDREDCINSDTGELCTCTCHGVGQGFSWRPDPGSCAVIPATPGQGPTPGACTPAGGQGPCSNTAGDTCICTCQVNPAAPPANVWGAQDCGSEAAGLGFLVAIFGASWMAWRRRFA